MVTVDKRRKYVIVLDTETCPIDKERDGVSANNMWVYDKGWAVVDFKGRVYERRSFVNADIFLTEKDLMKSSYYANKIPKYWEDIKNGKRILTSFYNIRKTFLEDIQKYGIEEIYAHNARFDYVSLNQTERWLTKSKFRYYFPKDVVMCDTLKMARSILGAMPTYKKFCEDNGFMTKHKTPRPQYKAEVIYKFISKDLDFVEAHTGFEDVMIEKEILAYCYKRRNRVEEMKKFLFSA